jgi:hypothetical protein
MAADTAINDINWLDDTQTYSIDWKTIEANTTIATSATGAVVTGATGSTWGNVLIGGGTGGTGGNGYYTQPTWTTGTFTFTNPSPSTIINHKEICLDDPEADIKIRGTSLMDRIEQIERRLALINRNPKLEEDWPELREAAERYQQLAQEFEDKQAVWDRLNRPMSKTTP